MGKKSTSNALGIILYEILTGNVPFDGESGQEIILKHLTADPDVRALPEPFASAVSKALAKNPVSRFRDVREMLEPIGLQLDPAGLAQRRSVDSVSQIPVAKFVSASNDPNPKSAPPIIQPIGYGRSPEMVFGPVVNNPRPIENESGSVFYREPIARTMRGYSISTQDVVE